MQDLEEDLVDIIRCTWAVYRSVSRLMDLSHRLQALSNLFLPRLSKPSHPKPSPVLLHPSLQPDKIYALQMIKADTDRTQLHNATRFFCFKK